MAVETKSKTVRAGSKTYFFDLRSTSSDKTPFLAITESVFKGEGEERERSTVTVFPEHIDEFLAVLKDMAQESA